MKKIISILAGALLCSCTSSAQKTETANTQDTDDMKVLVAYYSATGTTERVAKAIAEATDGTLYAITPEAPYTSADLNWRDSRSRSSVEMNDSTSRPALGGDKINAADYEVVFIGYPIWWDLCPRVVNTWIESQNLAGKKVIPFATSGGSTIGHSVADLRRLYPSLDWQDGKLFNGAPSEAASWAKKQIK